MRKGDRQKKHLKKLNKKIISEGDYYLELESTHSILSNITNITFETNVESTKCKCYNLYRA